MFSSFITCRFGEALREALLLREALAERGVTAYVDESGTGEDIFQNISNALVNCKLAIILATETYGKQTGGVFDTYKELSYILGNKKPYILVKMCQNFTENVTIMTFSGNTVGYTLWMPGTPMPADLVDKIVGRLDKLGVACGEGAAAKPVHQMMSPQAAGAEDPQILRAVTEMLQAMRVDDPSAAVALVKYGACSAEDISLLDEDAVTDMKKNYGLKPLTAQKLLKHIQQAEAEAEAKRKQALEEVKKKYSVKTAADLEKPIPGNAKGDTPLHKCAREGDLKMVELCLSAGSPLNVGNNDGWTPLFIAAMEGHLPVVERLLASNADVHKAMTDGSAMTPLAVAAWRGHVEVVRVLLKADADKTAKTAYGTALQVAQRFVDDKEKLAQLEDMLR